MPLNDDGLTLMSNCLQAGLLYAQLHSASAGVSGTGSVCSVRMPVHWETPDGGEFGLISPLRFVAGTPNGAVYSVSLWDAEVDGTFYGEFVLTGDLTFNGEGAFQVTAIDFVGTATDA